MTNRGSTVHRETFCPTYLNRKADELGIGIDRLLALGRSVLASASELAVTVVLVLGFFLLWHFQFSRFLLFLGFGFFFKF